MNRKSAGTRLLATAALVAFLLAPSFLSAASAEIYRFDGNQIEVRNLIGEVRVESHGGSGFEVEVQVGGKDATEGMIQISKSSEGLDVLFPGGHSEFVYPELGKNSRSSISIGRSSNRDLLHGPNDAGQIEVRGSGSGTELWADVVVRVPRGGVLEVGHGVGAIRVDGVDGELELSSQAGLVAVQNSSGEISAATGSGEIELFQVQATDVEIGAGSGDIKVEDCSGDDFEIGAGSGNVTIQGLIARDVEIGTGSGNVFAEQLEADSAEIGTGSGEVRVNLVGVTRGNYEIGAGSGNIDVELTRGADALVHAETNSGEIDVEVGAGASYAKKEKDEVTFTLGSGSARVEVGTGSGDIRIRG